MPRLIHQIWIGPDLAPTDLIDTWRTSHSQSHHRPWTAIELDALEWRAGCRNLFKRYVAEGCWHGAANEVGRVEILRSHGGVYLDADTLCLRPLDEADFMAAGFWVSESPHAAGRPQDAAMGCPPGHPLVDVYSDALPTGEVAPSRVDVAARPDRGGRVGHPDHAAVVGARGRR